jgi:hypothetical protein
VATAASEPQGWTVRDYAKIALFTGVAIGVGVFLGPEVIALLAGGTVLRFGLTALASALVGAEAEGIMQMGSNIIDGIGTPQGIDYRHNMMPAMASGALSGAMGGTYAAMLEQRARQLQYQFTQNVFWAIAVQVSAPGQVFDFFSGNNQWDVSLFVNAAVGLARAVVMKKGGIKPPDEGPGSWPGGGKRIRVPVPVKVGSGG